MKKYIFLSLISLGFTSSQTNASSFDIIDFRFALDDPTFSTWQTPQGANNMDPSLYGTLIESTYQGSNTTNTLINFDFFGGPLNVYTASSNQGSINTPAGTIAGGPAPTIDLINLTADMSSWLVSWNGTEFNSGNNSNFSSCLSGGPADNLLSSTATVTNNGNNNYTVNWNSCINTTSAKTDRIAFWQLDLVCTNCEATVVPLPASVWLFGSGLLGLVSIFKRKKTRGF